MAASQPPYTSGGLLLDATMARLAAQVAVDAAFVLEVAVVKNITRQLGEGRLVEQLPELMPKASHLSVGDHVWAVAR